MSLQLSMPVDFERHNEEVRQVWDAYRRREPSRVPVTISGSIRNLFASAGINDTGYTFEDFFKKPEAQVRCQLAYQKWVRHNVLCDVEMGLPRHGWQLSIDFQNSYEAGWMGCPLVFSGNDVPDTVEILREDKRRLYRMQPPDLLRGNLLGRAMEFFEYMQGECPRLEFEGRPVLPPVTLPGEGTDGPFDLAYKLRGATEACIDMMEDPGYFHDLMLFITDAIIRRMKAIREWRWARLPKSPDKGQFRRPGWGFADDAIALLSTEQYAEFIYPYHRRFVDEFSDGGPISMHLCGDATRHFRFLKEKFSVMSFDTGFPVDFGWLRRELGTDVEVRGGPTVMLLRSGSPAAIQAEVRRICESGIMVGGRFILREGNNMAPGTAVENIVTMYEAAKRYGVYPKTR